MYLLHLKKAGEKEWWDSAGRSNQTGMPEQQKGNPVS